MFKFNSTIALKIYLAFSLMLIGTILLICRNPDPLIHPIIYAEDGVWTGRGLLQGWLSPLLHARGDYLVVGNVMLLWLATQCSMILFENPIAHFPESIALIACAFYSMVVVLTFYSTRGLMPLVFRGGLFFLLLLIPLGGSQNEIIGRISQIGYYIPLVSIILFYLRDKSNKLLLKNLIDLLIILCAATNPVIIVFILLYLIWDIFQYADFQQAFRKNAILIILLFLISSYVFPKIINNPYKALQGFNINSIIETIGARLILFPILFPWYGKLCNFFTILLLIAWFSLIAYSYLKSESTLGKRLSIFFFVGLIVVIILTLVMRPGLTIELHGYQKTFPDRYFMGTNIITISLTLLALGQLALSSKKINIFLGWSGFFAIIAIYLFHLSLLFEIHSTRWPLIDKLTFVDQIRSTKVIPGATSVEVPIYPITWKMEIPVKWINMIKNTK
jgi:hypothetical protein